MYCDGSHVKNRLFHILGAEGEKEFLDWMSWVISCILLGCQQVWVVFLKVS